MDTLDVLRVGKCTYIISVEYLILKILKSFSIKCLAVNCCAGSATIKSSEQLFCLPALPWVDLYLFLQREVIPRKLSQRTLKGHDTSTLVIDSANPLGAVELFASARSPWLSALLLPFISLATVHS